MVLDGPVDANSYINTPSADLREQSAAFERALGRFFQACAAYQSFCNFGGTDPQAAFDNLIDQANILPIPVPDGRAPVNGDDVIGAAALALYAKQYWPLLANALAEAAAGDASTLRFLADAAWGNNVDGTFDPGTDRYFTIGAIEQKYPTDIQTFLDAGDNSWGMFEHFWSGTPATSSSTTGSGRSTRRTRSAGRSRPPSRRRRSSRSPRRTTRPRRTAAPSGSRRSSATSAS